MDIPGIRTIVPALLLVSALAVLGQTTTGGKSFNFGGDAVGAAPAGFEFARTGSGAEGKWVVEADGDKADVHVLAQRSADPTDYRFPLAIVKDGTYKDVTV